MYEDLRSSTVFSPETMGELVNYKRKNPAAIFWAGGTYLMGKALRYPSKEPIDIISLEKMGELKRITRNDTSVEFGAMANLQSAVSLSRAFFSPEICAALSSIGTQIVRNQATVGGALCTQRIKTSFAAIMSTLDATAECRIIGKKPVVKWVAVDKMFDKTGSLILPPSALVTKLHVNECKDSQFFFKATGSPMTESQDAVICAIRCKLMQNSIVETRACFNFLQTGMHNSEMIQSTLTGTLLPVNPVRIIKLTSLLMGEIKEAHPSIRPIQAEQASRMFESFLYDLNAQIIARN